MPFTPVQTLVGAAMMGMAANNVLVLNGGVLGISGFAHRTVAAFIYSIRQLLRGGLDAEKEDANPDPEQLALLSMAGLLAGGVALGLSSGQLENQMGVQLVDAYVSGTADWMKVIGYAVGGALVGFGSKLANGCTSGHMLCGVSRLSPRSLIATGIFFPIAVITHLLLGHYALFSIELAPERETGTPSWLMVLLLQIPVLVYRYGAAFLKGFAGDRAARRLVAFSTAFHFSLGLTLSGMLRPSKILNFLNMTPSAIRTGAWDPSLVLVIVGGIIPQLLIWQCCLGAYIRRSDSQPKFAENWSIPKLATNSNWKEGITLRLVVGSVVFGVGWGLCGICPGPGAISLGAVISGDQRLQLWRVGVWAGGFVFGGVVGGVI